MTNTCPDQQFRFVRPERRALFVTAETIPDEFVGHCETDPFPFRDVAGHGPANERIHGMDHPAAQRSIRLAAAAFPQHTEQRIDPLQPDFPGSVLTGGEVERRQIAQCGVRPRQRKQADIRRPHKIGIQQGRQQFFQIFRRHNDQKINLCNSGKTEPGHQIFSTSAEGMEAVATAVMPSILTTTRFPREFFTRMSWPSTPSNTPPVIRTLSPFDKATSSAT